MKSAGLVRPKILNDQMMSKINLEVFINLKPAFYYVDQKILLSFEHANC
jgi:hypothetical protein